MSSMRWLVRLSAIQKCCSVKVSGCGRPKSTAAMGPWKVTRFEHA
jgi:hypothetical protein